MAVLEAEDGALAVGEAEVWLGSRRTVPLLAQNNIVIGGQRGAQQGLTARIVYDGPIHPPIAEGAVVAHMVIEGPNYPALYGSLDETYGHFRRYTRHSIAACVTAAGFRVVALRHFNPLAIPGWVLSAKVLRSRQLNVHAARLFNAIVPLARRLDFLSRFGGLALLVVAER